MVDLVRRAVSADAVTPAHAGHTKRNVMFLSAAATFALVWFLMPSSLHGTIRFVTAFDVAGALLLALLVRLGMHADAALTQRRAAVDDPGRNVALAVVILSAVVGFASAITVLGTDLPKAHGLTRYIDLIIGIAAVVIGWALIHTNFLFRYAYLYYYDKDGDGHPSGIEFPGGAPPNDYDFAYFSFVIGMTFQVSDVNITETRIRRQALVHSLISFAYSAGIIALGVNIASGLLH